MKDKEENLTMVNIAGFGLLLLGLFLLASYPPRTRQGNEHGNRDNNGYNEGYDQYTDVQLSDMLKHAETQEDYETAAEIRDTLKSRKSLSA